ncbi:MAG TPA: AAA family ATPase, partial [Actinomycetota bacterium]|nr:AAA family ATPase [Actinomycetota bacterium]
MLRELHVSGLGVFDDLDLELHPGLNVLTGETGAGKTMVTVGLLLALGAKASASLVRPGAPAARVQARFDAPASPLAQGWAEDGELVLARSVGADGRGSARICGQLVTVSTLASLGRELVEVHGQHQAQRLLQPSVQRALLDRSAGPQHAGRAEALREAHAELRRAERALEELAASARERERELDLLAYQIREIEGADLRPGLAAELEAEEARLAHAERLAELAAAAAGELER